MSIASATGCDLTGQKSHYAPAVLRTHTELEQSQRLEDEFMLQDYDPLEEIFPKLLTSSLSVISGTYTLRLFCWKGSASRLRMIEHGPKDKYLAPNGRLWPSCMGACFTSITTSSFYLNIHQLSLYSKSYPKANTLLLECGVMEYVHFWSFCDENSFTSRIHVEHRTMTRKKLRKFGLMQTSNSPLRNANAIE